MPIRLLPCKTKGYLFGPISQISALNFWPMLRQKVGQETLYSFHWALLHKARPRRHSPDPRRSYAIAIVSGVPSSVKRLSNATRTCSSVTWRSNVRAITRSPSRLKQCILVSTKLRRW